ncbi:MAG: hypothetical protein ACK559_36000, partial [bacterium]
MAGIGDRDLHGQRFEHRVKAFLRDRPLQTGQLPPGRCSPARRCIFHYCGRGSVEMRLLGKDEQGRGLGG